MLGCLRYSLLFPKESGENMLIRAVARALIGGGGGGVYSYIRVMPD